MVEFPNTPAVPTEKGGVKIIGGKPQNDGSVTILTNRVKTTNIENDKKKTEIKSKGMK